MRDTRFEATYEAEDGYAGGSRPQHFEIRPEDVEEDMDDAALTELFEAQMQEHFQQNIYPTKYQSSLDEFIDWAKQVQTERERDDASS